MPIINLGRPHPYADGERRVITKFLWFPKTLPVGPFDNDERMFKWLVTASWKERYHHTKWPGAHDWWSEEHWEDEK